MTRHDDDGGFSATHKSLVTAAVPPIPLKEARIQETLRRAQAEFRRRQGRKRLARGLASILFLLTLIAAGFWKWSGRNSEQELTFGAAITVTQNHDEYSFENVRSASLKIWRDARGILAILVKQGAITPAMRGAILDSIDRPDLIGEAYQGGFEDLSLRVQSARALDPQQLTQLTDALKAGISALRQLGLHHPDHASFGKNLCQRLRNQVSGEAATSPDQEGQSPPQEKRRD